jgi:hypothetical protein
VGSEHFRTFHHRRLRVLVKVLEDRFPVNQDKAALGRNLAEIQVAGQASRCAFEPRFFNVVGRIWIMLLADDIEDVPDSFDLDQPYANGGQAQPIEINNLRRVNQKKFKRLPVLRRPRFRIDAAGDTPAAATFWRD